MDGTLSLVERWFVCVRIQADSPPRRSPGKRELREEGVARSGASKPDVPHGLLDHRGLLSRRTPQGFSSLELPEEKPVILPSQQK